MRRLFKGLALPTALFFAAINLIGCATSSTYMKKEEQTKAYNASQKEVFDAVIASAGDLKWKVGKTDPANGIINLHPPVNVWSSSLVNMMAGGDLVEVTLTKVNENETKIFVECMSRGEVLDLGRSAGNVKALYKKLDARWVKERGTFQR